MGLATGLGDMFAGAKMSKSVSAMLDSLVRVLSYQQSTVGSIRTQLEEELFQGYRLGVVDSYTQVA